MRKLIPVSGTLLEIKNWLYDWKLAKEKDNIPPYLMTHQDKRNEIYWHASGSNDTSVRVSFMFEHKKAGYSLVEFTCEDDAQTQDYVNILLSEFSEKWQTHTPPIGFLSVTGDKDFANLLENRWLEAEKAISAEAYLSATVLLGSILEGILFDMCNRYPVLAGSANSKPKKKSLFSEWSLESLIDVSTELGWLSFEASEQSKSLRKYRNLIHPREQLKLDFYPRKETCELSQLVLSLAVSDIYKWLKNDNK